MTVFPKKLNSLVIFIVERPVTQTDEVDINTQSKKFVKFKFLDEKGKNNKIDPTVITRKKPKVKTAFQINLQKKSLLMKGHFSILLIQLIF